MISPLDNLLFQRGVIRALVERYKRVGGKLVSAWQRFGSE